MIDHPQQIDTKDVFGVEDSGEIVVTDFVCGINNSGVILSDGSCYVWGANKNGQLGLGHKKEVPLPTLLTLPKEGEASGLRSFHLGNTFSAAVDTNGNLYTFGYGGSAYAGMGWLGHGDGESYLEPKRVESLVEDGCEVKGVHVGENHLAVLTTEGELLTGKLPLMLFGSIMWDYVTDTNRICLYIFILLLA